MNSTVRTLNDQLGNISATLSSREKDLYNAAIEEAGSAEHIYLEVTNGLLSSSCVCHHGLLLPTERHLHESLFQRPDGITVMVATSTLAQGMNLPSEVVIIVGDSRFDPQAEKMEQLDAHEVLNAAGRAGRAGESAYGMVIMVPTKVIDFSDGDNTINKYWENLQAVFGQSDQCLNIKDPLAALLDQIQLSQATPTEMMQYFISRLPVELNDEAKPDVDGARVLLRKSFGAYIKRAKEHDPQWIEARITTVLALRDKERNNAPITWVERLAANIGVPLDVIRYFGEWLNPLILPDLNSIFAWKKCVFEVISNKPDAMIKLVRQTTLEGLFGTPYKELTTDANRGSYALPKLEKMLDVWMAGGTLANIEIAFGTAQTKLGKCENAREFVIRMVPELAYVFGLPLLVAKALHEEKGRPDEIPGLALETLGRCVKEGFDVPEKLVLKAMKDPISRIAAHLEFAKISAKLQPASEAEDFDMAFRRVRGAL